MIIEIVEYITEKKRYIFIDDENFATGSYDEEGNFIVDHKGEYKAFYDDGSWHDEQDFDNFNIIKEFKELDRDIDFYGVGYDRIKALIDGEEVYLSASRWTSGNIQKGYIFKDWV